MTRHAVVIACALAGVVPARAFGQAVNGVAEWTTANGSSVSDGVPYVNRSFWQSYTMAFKSVLLDPRFLEYSASTTFRSNGLTFGGSDSRQHGRSNDLGYALDASLFPARPFPFVIQATRTNIEESGDYPLSNGIRGSLPVPSGEASPVFLTRNDSLSMGWRLAAARLPHVELDYRKSNSVASSGGVQAEQHDLNLHARVSQDTRRTRQALVYQRTATDNLTTQAFNLRLTELSYDGSATLGQRNRLTLRAGRRQTFSLFDIPAPIVDPGTGAYRLPSRGTVDAFYAISGLSYEPQRRIAFDLTASLDQQDSLAVRTGAKMLSTSARFEPLRGLSLFVTGAYGLRDQSIAGVAVNALTQNVQAGASYRVGMRWFNANVAYARGMGSNSTPGGGVGALNSWTGQAGLSISVRGFTIGGGYERARSEDQTFAFGNYDNQRQFATVQLQAGGLMIAGSFDRASFARGRDITFSEARQDTFTASISTRLTREGRLTLGAGGFSSEGTFGHDQTLFCDLSLDAQILPRLTLTMSARYDDLKTSGTGLTQKSLGGFAKLDYHVRLFVFALEYYNRRQDLRYALQPDAHAFKGSQILLRVSRTFGFRF